MSVTSLASGHAVQDSAAGKSKVILNHVSKGFGEEWEWEQVVKDLTFEIKPGLLTALVGPSGCGKSTVASMVAGYETPDTGEILLNGSKITGPGKDRMVVFQETALMPWQTSRQNLEFGPKIRREMRGRELRKISDELLVKVGLGDFKEKYPSQLSGGMQRRAELARALINQPVLLIMDEPFRGLDAMSRPLMQEFFLKLFEENRRTNLFVTSEVEEAIFLADRLVVLSNRPASVRTIIDIPLPRPRKLSMLNSPEAYEIKREAMELLHEEAMKSFSQVRARA